MTRISLAALFAASLALLAQQALAHDDAFLDKQAAPHGGQLRQAGLHHFELVMVKGAKATSPSPLVVHVTDHAGTAVPTKGAKGSATILTGSTKINVPLDPGGDNRMQGSAKYAVTPETKVVVTITLAGGAAGQARFTPGASSTAGH